MAGAPLYNFPGKDEATLSEVGGKGLSLMIASRDGLPVPAGFILSVVFFEPWMQQLKATAAWADFLQADEGQLENACRALKDKALQLVFTNRQRENLSGIEQNCGEFLFAVRSSSPEEDLDGASFAGGYETILGVTSGNMEAAVRSAFASCLAYRVVVYKRENGFTVGDPKIAVIVQQQIASEVAGVGFSLNPVTNNYDEAVFNANWGLGETVVSGTATPDTFIADKISLKVKSRTLGSKQKSIWLTPSGGMEEKRDPRNQEWTLSDNQVAALTKLIGQVETMYSKPIDIEWAYSRDKLYLLQARPISVYVPLAPEMITAPGERKRLYVDSTIALQGIYKPLSVAGSSFFRKTVRSVGGMFFLRDITGNIETAIPWVAPGRLFVNVSNLMRLVHRKNFLDFMTVVDPLTAKAICTVGPMDYLSGTSKVKLLPIGAVIQLPRLALQMLRGWIWPERTHLRCQRRLGLFARKARELASQEPRQALLAEKLIALFIRDVAFKTVPLFVLGRMMLSGMKKMAGKESELAFAPLEVALPNNVTTQMGLALSCTAELLPDKCNLKEIEARLGKRTLPDPFLSSWDTFLDTYGHGARGRSTLPRPDIVMTTPSSLG